MLPDGGGRLRAVLCQPVRMLQGLPDARPLPGGLLLLRALRLLLADLRDAPVQRAAGPVGLEVHRIQQLHAVPLLCAPLGLRGRLHLLTDASRRPPGICHVAAAVDKNFEDAAQIIDCIADCVYHVTVGCMVAQTSNELNYQFSLGTVPVATAEPSVAAQEMER